MSKLIFAFLLGTAAAHTVPHWASQMEKPLLDMNGLQRRLQPGGPSAACFSKCPGLAALGTIANDAEKSNAEKMRSMCDNNAMKCMVSADECKEGKSKEDIAKEAVGADARECMCKCPELIEFMDLPNEKADEARAKMVCDNWDCLDRCFSSESSCATLQQNMFESVTKATVEVACGAKYKKVGASECAAPLGKVAASVASGSTGAHATFAAGAVSLLIGLLAWIA